MASLRELQQSFVAALRDPAVACPVFPGANLGVYRNNAFRSSDLGFRERHFEPDPPAFRLRERCRAPVSFRVANLLGADDALGTSHYAAIFCRNVLIYLDRPAQQRALDVLQRLLEPGGLLFVGPSETTLLSDRDFTPLRVPLAFAFRRGASARQSGSRETTRELTVRAAPPASKLSTPRRGAEGRCR